MSVAPVFIRSLRLVAVRAVRHGLDPVGEFLLTNRNRAESHNGTIMNKRKYAGSSKSGQDNMQWNALEIVHPDAAGIDVGGREHWVAISPDRDPKPVRCFGSFTSDLRDMAKWLVERGVRSVALQSTGVYWMPVLE